MSKDNDRQTVTVHPEPGASVADQTALAAIAAVLANQDTACCKKCGATARAHWEQEQNHDHSFVVY